MPIELGLVQFAKIRLSFAELSDFNIPLYSVTDK